MSKRQTISAYLHSPPAGLIGAAILSGLMLPALASAAGSFQIEPVAALLILILLLNGGALLHAVYRRRSGNAPLASHYLEGAPEAARIDPLTGFLERSEVGEAFAHLFDKARADGRVCALIVDIDGFKTVNDLQGHLAGDNLLRTAADLLRAELPAGTVLGRLGPDRFAAGMSFPDDQSPRIDRIIAAILEKLGKPFNLAGVHVHVSASAGAARAKPGEADVDALMRQADIALSRAKLSGHGHHAWFDESMRRELHNRNEIEAGLRTGIPTGEFEPFFEQQIDLATGSLVGFEMLARWLHPEKGVLCPDLFIPVAEECGLIGDLSLSVMRQAMVEARSWDGGLSLAVNISPVQLKDPWLAQKIAKLLSETGFPAERLEVEITESSLFEHLGLAQAIVCSLKNQGVRLALDDFGTGYSSLAHLRALPFDRIKIDRSFIASINRNAETVSVVTAITRLAESLNLAVTAEGVEDGAIEARLRSIGAYCVQGWHYGKPMQIADVRAMLAERNLLASGRKVGVPGSADDWAQSKLRRVR